MDQKTYTTMRQIIGGLYNSWSQGNEDIELRFETFASRLDGVPMDALQITANRFLDAEVEGHDSRFAPSVPEVVAEAKRIADLRSYRDRPALPAPSHYSSTPPFMVRTEKARTRFAGWSVFKADVGYDEARNLSKAGQLPVGATWSGCLATIFLPPVKE